MNQIEAFRETLTLAVRKGMPGLSSLALGDGLDYWHLQDMLGRIDADPTAFSEAKLGRWLGWAQAGVVAARIGLTLDDMKEINRRWQS